MGCMSSESRSAWMRMSRASSRDIVSSLEPSNRRKGRKDKVRCIDPTAAGPTFGKDLINITLVPGDLRLTRH